MRYLKSKSVNFEPAKKAPLAKRTSPEAVLILILLVVAFVSCLDMRLFQVYFYQGVGYLLNVFTVILCFGLYLIRHRKYGKTDAKLIAFAIFMIIYCMISAFLTNGGLRYVGTVFNTVILVIILRDSEVSFRAIRNVSVIIICVMVIIAFNSSGYYDSQFIHNAVNSNYIAQLAVAGMVYVNYFLCFVKDTKPYRIAAARILIDLISFYIIWECQSRGSLLALVFFNGMFYLFPKRWMQKKNLITGMSTGITILGVFFTYFYLKFIVPVNFLFMGKSTLTRSRLWTYFWGNVGGDPIKCIIGYGTNDTMRDLFGYGFHNIYLGIWYDIGLFGLIWFMGFIFWNIREVYKRNRELNMFVIYAIIGFMSFQLSDYFAITFTGPLVIWNYIMLGFIAMAQKKEDKK